MAKSRGTGLKDKSEDSEPYHLAYPSKYRPSAARCGNNIYTKEEACPSVARHYVLKISWIVNVIIYMNVFLRKKHPMYIIVPGICIYSSWNVIRRVYRILKKLELFFFVSGILSQLPNNITSILRNRMLRKKKLLVSN